MNVKLLSFLLSGLPVAFTVAARADDAATLVADSRGDLARARSLLTDGVAVNGKDSDGETPVIMATQNGHTEFVDALLEAADMNPRMYAGGGEHTALSIAAQVGHTPSVALIAADEVAVRSSDQQPAPGNSGETADWRTARTRDTIDAYLDYKRRYPHTGKVVLLDGQVVYCSEKEPRLGYIQWIERLEKSNLNWDALVVTAAMLPTLIDGDADPVKPGPGKVIVIREDGSDEGAIRGFHRDGAVTGNGGKTRVLNPVPLPCEWKRLGGETQAQKGVSMDADGTRLRISLPDGQIGEMRFCDRDDASLFVHIGSLNYELASEAIASMPEMYRAFYAAEPEKWSHRVGERRGLAVVATTCLNLSSILDDLGVSCCEFNGVRYWANAFGRVGTNMHMSSNLQYTVVKGVKKEATPRTLEEFMRQRMRLSE